MVMLASQVTYLVVFLSVVTENSPYYYENEFDETVLVDTDEQDEEREILNWLGLSEPDTSQNWTRESLSQSAPNFLLQMYEMLNNKMPIEDFFGGRERRHAHENRLISPVDEIELQESDIIMTFMSNSARMLDKLIFEQRSPNTLWFNVSQIPDDVSLITAQLKVYKQKTKKMTDFFEISVYAIRYQAKHESELTLITSLQTSPLHEGWLQLDVTKALRKWQMSRVTNQGLLLEASISDGPATKEVSLTTAGLISLKSTSSMNPFMVGYFKNDEVLSSRSIRRRRRQNHNKSGRGTSSELPKYRRNCQRLNFSVDFKKLNWLNWIVAPEKFDSYFCSGDCSFPLNDINTTNHAIIQTLAHLKNPDLPKPCCAPTALTSIVIIYHVSQDVVNMKKYSNMVVESCGCL